MTMVGRLALQVVAVVMVVAGVVSVAVVYLFVGSL